MSLAQRLALPCVLVLLLGGTAPAAAEWFGDLYAGGAFTGSRDISVSSGPTLRNVSFDASGAGGARGGYWLGDFEYLGFALDVLHYRPDVGSQTVRTDAEPATLSLGTTDLRLTNLAFDVMLRVPLLKSAGMPLGPLRPFFLVGPVLTIATADDTINFGPPNHQSHSSARAGFNVGAGLLWQLSTHVGVFGEYRYVRATPEFKFANSTDVQFDINTHLVLGGISFSF